jgi:hypothetical protein
MMKNPYGICAGQVVVATDPTIPRGLACGCSCPGCGARLELHKGTVISPYFAHEDGADCAHATQTALHLLAKEVLEEERKLRLPGITVSPSEHLGHWTVRKRYPSRTLVRWQTIVADEVTLERKLSNIVPDVLFRVRDRSLIVEIRVAHAVDAEKKRKLEALGIAAIEFDFSKMNRVVTKAEIKKALVLGDGTPGQGRGEWVYHPELAKAQQEIDEGFLAKKPAIMAEIAREEKRRREEWKRKQKTELNQRIQEYTRVADERSAEQRRKKGYLFDA